MKTTIITAAEFMNAGYSKVDAIRKAASTADNWKAANGGKRFSYTNQVQIRKAFWESHPELEAHALKWQIKTAPQNRHNSDTRMAFVEFIDHIYRNGQISFELANRATL